MKLLPTTSLLALALTLAPGLAFADDDDSAAHDANSGLHFGIGPVLLLPSGGGSVGGGLDLDLRYGIDAGPTVIGPGGRLAGYYLPDHFVGMALPTLRVTFPVGPFAPFVVGGVGGGWVTNPSQSGVALMGGGGLMIHFGRVFGIGAEATYQTITNTDFKVWTIGPSILIGF